MSTGSLAAAALSLLWRACRAAAAAGALSLVDCHLVAVIGLVDEVVEGVDDEDEDEDGCLRRWLLPPLRVVVVGGGVDVVAVVVVVV